MLSLKSFIIAGAVALSLLVAPVTPTMASVKVHPSLSAKAKTTAVAHKQSHKAAAKKVAKIKVKAKKTHKPVAAKAHRKAASH
jgi:hypothetical protein